MSGFFSGVFLSLLSLLGNSGDVDFVFFGDAMQHAPQITAAHRGGNTYDYSECFQYIEPDIKGADCAVVNLEVSLGGAPYTGYPCFSAPDEWAAQLQRSGFDLLLTANNHCLDRRDKGAVRTIEVLDKLGIPHVGTYENAAARAKQLPCIQTIKGLKVAFLDYTYGTNGIPIQKDVVVDYIDKALIAKDIEAARKAGAQVLCVNMHWGIEYTLTPVQEQKDLADFLVEQGVDLIIGGHPHVVEPFEMRHSTRWNKDVLLVYSLGNMISNMTKPDCRGGAMVKVKVQMRNGKPVVHDARYKLFFCQKPVAGKNYTLIPEERRDLVHAGQLGAFDTFMSRTHGLVMKKNINVPQER
jgi:poly-gamma-glutamate synthesis protein (capsule biosynthesis protein)